MKVLISADMEGTTGVTCLDDVIPERSGYPRFRKLLTNDVNAAIEGALEAGATEIVISEAHSHSRNILIEELNPKAKMITGFLGRRYDMMEGIDDMFDAVFLVAYHAKAGTDSAVINHTLFLNILNFWINGVLVGEGGISAAWAGHFNVPVVLVTGDDKVASEMMELLGDVEPSVVKRGLHDYTAECLTPKESYETIKNSAKRALKRLKDFKPYKIKPPVTIDVEFASTSPASLACIYPKVVRKEPRKISFTSGDLIETMNTILASTMLASTDKNW